MKMKSLLPLVVALLFSAGASAADVTNIFVLPPAVPGIPIGWCIRAQTNVFVDAKNAGYEYVELALQDVYNLSDADFENLLAALEAQGIPARTGYNPLPKNLMLVGTNVDREKLDAHVQHLLSRAKREKPAV